MDSHETDGFSRLWLDVATTNNKPEVMVNNYKKVPAILRPGMGTKTSLIEYLQIAFRSNADDENSGMNSCIELQIHRQSEN